MGADLVRFGVAMDADLLTRFDEHIERRGYVTRSEALRDLVRADLAAQHVEGGGMAAATLTIIYDHHVRELTEKLTAMQHDLGECVVSTLHVHLDHDHCLEVIVLRGPADRLRSAGDRVIATKGVENGRLVITALPGAEHGGHGHKGGGAKGAGGGSGSGSGGGGGKKVDHDHDHDHDHGAGQGQGQGQASGTAKSANRGRSGQQR